MKKSLFIMFGIMTALGTITLVHADDKATPCTSIEQTQGVKNAGDGKAAAAAPAPVVSGQQTVK